ncbi:hypothetical protein RRG08_011627 [Elysia crispata]|uniref:TIR domain-containing protein n=1 Tax=Elysia crispata TaxID=231223 RepID=A0AAE0Y145_9GAST|nr:hypothetical protein RRG08_011627 [Elysia crispata]
MASKWIRRFSGFRQLVLILACLQFVSHSLGAYHRVESMEIATSVMGSDAEELAYEIGKRKILNRNDMLSSGEFSLQSTHLFSRETFKENSWFPECSVCEELLPPPESVWTNAGHQNDHRPSQPKLRAAPDGEECCKVNGAEADCRYCDLRTVPSRLSPEITRLLLGHNAITDKSLSRGVFKRYSQLKLLSLSSNLITSLADGIFEGLPSLRCLCLQFNNIRMDDTLNSSLAFQPLAESLVYLRLNGFNKNTTDINMMYPSYALSFLSKLKYLFIDGIPFTRFQNPQRKLHKLTHLGMAGFRYGYCNLRGLQREAFELDTLTHLDISDCNLRGIYVDKSAFENLQSLQSLKISNNFHLGIQKAGEMMYGLRNNRHLTTLTMQRINPSQNLLSGTLDGDHDGCIFKNLKRLKSLGLALNDIFRLNPKSFKSLTNLQYLNISQNRLHQINFSIAHMKNLKILDLQKNQIQSLSRQTRLEIDKISEGREPPLMNLSYNPISCDCENLEFLEWLSGTALADFDFRGAPYYCGMEQQANGYRDVIVLLRRRCIKQEELFAVVTSASIVAVLAFAALFAYRFRWTLRYWYHAARLKFQPVVSPEDFDFDVFVSYSDKDDFVEEELIPRLQDEYNFRVMMHGLCFPAGAHITDSVHTAVTTSRKTLVVITKNMLRSHWCNYELMMARREEIRRGKQVLVFLFLEDLTYSEMTSNTAAYVQESTYITYPPEPRYRSAFWRKLADDLRADVTFS